MDRIRIQGGQSRYNDLLLSVSQRGDWSPWIDFFLTALLAEAKIAWNKAKKLRDLRDRFRQRLGSNSAKLRIDTVDFIIAWPVFRVRDLRRAIGVTDTTVRNYVKKLLVAGIIVPVDVAVWGQTYFATDVINILYHDYEDDLIPQGE